MSGRPVFYGWVVVAVAWMLSVINLAGFTWGFTIFVQPLAAEFGWSHTSITFAWAASLGWALLLGPWSGLMFDRYGPRPLLAVGGVTGGLGWLLIPYVSQYWVFFALFVFGVGTGLNGTLGTVGGSTIAQWFTKRRALAMGLSLTSSGGAGIVLLPVLNMVVDSHGWRMGAIVIGLLTAVCAFAAIPLMRHRPENYGQVPDGEMTTVSVTPSDRRPTLLSRLPLPHRTAPTTVDFTLSEALRTAAFWLFTAAIWLRNLGLGMSQVHLTPFLTGQGYSSGFAAMILSASLIVVVPVRISVGWLGVLYEQKWLLSLCTGAGGIAFLALIFSTPSVPGIVWVYPILWGVGLGSLPLQAAWMGDTFGRRHYGVISSTANSLTLSARIVGALLAAAAFDILGSYRVIFLVGAVGFFVGAITLAFLPLVSARQRARGPDRVGLA